VRIDREAPDLRELAGTSLDEALAIQSAPAKQAQG
jgi:hypothetical protein